MAININMSKISNLATALFTTLFVVDGALVIAGKETIFNTIIEKLGIHVTYDNTTGLLVFTAVVGYLALYNLYEAIFKR